MGEIARGHILFDDQELVGNKTVRLTMRQDIHIRQGDVLEIEFNDTMGPFVVSLIREMSMPETRPSSLIGDGRWD